jgi:hypothetical protein
MPCADCSRNKASVSDLFQRCFNQSHSSFILCNNLFNARNGVIIISVFGFIIEQDYYHQSLTASGFRKYFTLKSSKAIGQLAAFGATATIRNSTDLLADAEWTGTAA